MKKKKSELLLRKIVMPQGTWLAQSEEPVTFDHGVVSSSPMLSIEMTLKKIGDSSLILSLLHNFDFLKKYCMKIVFTLIPGGLGTPRHWHPVKCLACLPLAQAGFSGRV